MIYLAYAVVAAIVVFLSIKVADYVDMIDKTTSLSGAFIGGILLSAVTSLPELLTTISATAWIGNSGLSIGNILGSNIFNFLVLFIADVIYTKGSIYLFNDGETVNLLAFGAISTPLMLLVLNGKYYLGIII